MGPFETLGLGFLFCIGFLVVLAGVVVIAKMMER